EGDWTIVNQHLRGGAYWTIVIPGLQEAIDIHTEDPNSETIAKLIVSIPSLVQTIAQLQYDLAMAVKDRDVARNERERALEEHDRLRSLNAELCEELEKIAAE